MKEKSDALAAHEQLKNLPIFVPVFPAKSNAFLVSLSLSAILSSPGGDTWYAQYLSLPAFFRPEDGLTGH